MSTPTKYTEEFKNKVVREYYNEMSKGRPGSKYIIAKYGKKIYLNISVSWAKKYRDSKDLHETLVIESKYSKLSTLYRELDEAMKVVKETQQKIQEIM